MTSVNISTFHLSTSLSDKDLDLLMLHFDDTLLVQTLKVSYLRNLFDQK